MPEREAQLDDRHALTRAVDRAARSPQGFSLTLQATDELRLALTGAGELTLWIAPKTGEEVPAEALSPPANLADTHQPEAASASTDSTERAEHRRVRISGRVATAPRYTPLPNRELRVGFRVAEPLPEGGTAFHDAYATGRFARAIQAKQLAIGDAVQITGERQQAVRVQNGERVPVERLFCYGVRITKTARPR